MGATVLQTLIFQFMNRQLRLFLSALLSCFVSLLLASSSWSQLPAAEQFNQDGFSLLQNGAAAEALSAWQEAEDLYRAEGNEEGIIGTQLNQALAEQALGLYPRACLTVAQSLSLPPQVCQPDQGSESVEVSLSAVEPTAVNLIGTRLLGESLTLLGNSEAARAVLNFAQAHLSSTSGEASRVALAIGNVHSVQAKEAIQTYERLGSRETQLRRDTNEQIAANVAEAMGQYQKASSSLEIGVKANLNIIDLLIWVQSSLRNPSLSSVLALPEFQQLEVEAQVAYERLQEDSYEQLPAIDAVYGRLNLARNLIATLEHKGFEKAFWSAIEIADIKPLLDSAEAIADKIGDRRALAFTYGLMADLKALRAAPADEIKNDYSRALAIAQSVQAFDISYELAYKLARLEENAGQRTIAAQHYRSAISALTHVRSDLVAVNTELRFNFKEKIEPVYRDYMKLLVAEGDQQLAQAVAIHDSLQLAQLENFLKCGRLLSPSSEDSVARTQIHIIDLGNTIEVIVDNQKGMYGYSLPARDVLQATRNLILNIQSPSFLATPEEEILPYSKLLYDQLIRPAIIAGRISNSEHLSFILDAPFQSVPMGLLHDGQQYLAATHVLSNSLRPQTPGIPSSRRRALFAGISQQAPSFAGPGFLPLPETEFEAELVSAYMRSKVLLDNDFTVEKLEDNIADDYQVVHISTHGQFSSVPEQTFLAAWDGLIDIREMATVFQSASSIDLLVLSACQTASGDERSSLGMAGIAVQTGARSVIASQWLVDSTGSSVLMDRFYNAMSQELDTAEALQQAQIELMESTAFSHPFYWAPFVLISG